MFKQMFTTSLAPSAVRSIHIGHLMQASATPLVMHTHSIQMIVAYVRYYPYPALDLLYFV